MNYQQYQDHLDVIKTRAMSDFASGKDVDLTRLVAQLDLDHQDNASILKFFREYLKFTKAEVKKTLDARKLELRRIAAIGSAPRTAALFVEAYFNHNRITADFRGAIVFPWRSQIVLDGKVTFVTPDDLLDPTVKTRCETFNAKRYTSDEILRELRILADDLSYTFDKDDIADAFDRWRDLQIDERVFAALDDTAFDSTAPSTDEAFLALARAAFSDEDIELNIAIMRKFYWQVKRKMRGRDVSSHLMPVLCGPQEIGKSVFLSRLISPLAEFSKRVNFKLVTDGKTKSIFRYFIHVYDEMAYANKADGERIKEIITSDSITIRTLFTNYDEDILQRSTPIGNANISLAELITDTTGNRRFAPMAFRPDADRDVINGTDYLALLKSVDENGPDPMIEYATRLKERQAANACTSLIQDWIEMAESCPFEVGVNDKGEISLQHLYDIYAQWEQTATRHALGNKKFNAELKRLVDSGKLPLRYAPRRASGTWLIWTEHVGLSARTLRVVEGMRRD